MKDAKQREKAIDVGMQFRDRIGRSLDPNSGGRQRGAVSGVRDLVFV